MVFPWSVSSKPSDKALDALRHIPSLAVHEGPASDFRTECGETLGTLELGRHLEVTCQSRIDPMRLRSTPHDRDLPQESLISQPLTDDNCGAVTAQEALMIGTDKTTYRLVSKSEPMNKRSVSARNPIGWRLVRSPESDLLERS